MLSAQHAEQQAKHSNPFHHILGSCSTHPCRFARLANGGSKVAIADMLQLPELSGNVLMEQILRLFDGDKDGYLSEKELIKAVQRLGELQQPDADPCQSEKQSLQLLESTTP